MAPRKAYEDSTIRRAPIEIFIIFGGEKGKKKKKRKKKEKKINGELVTLILWEQNSENSEKFC